MIEMVMYRTGRGQETLALMPTVSEAIEWVRAAWVDFPGSDGSERCGGDIYAHDGGLRTLLLTDGAILTVGQRDTVKELLSLTVNSQGLGGRRALDLAIRLQAELGIVERYQPGWDDPRAGLGG